MCVTEIQRVDVLQLAPRMFQKAMITEHERTELTSRLTSLDRGNKLTEIMMRKYSVDWLVKFCQCLLESYACERSLDIHYTLFQQIKGRGMCIVASLLQLTLEREYFCLNVHIVLLKHEQILIVLSVVVNSYKQLFNDIPNTYIASIFFLQFMLSLWTIHVNKSQVINYCNLTI